MGSLFLVFTLVPLIELYLLVQLAQIMGFASTVALVLLTGSVGAWLARAEGLRVLHGFRSAIEGGRVPEDGVISAVLVLVGGVLLVTPGVLTDGLGLALLVPWSRRQIARAVAAHIQRDVQRGRVRVVRQVVDLGAAGPTTQPDPFGGPQPRGRVIEVKSRVINSEKADQPNPGGD